LPTTTIEADDRSVVRRDSAEVMACMSEVGISAGPINTVGEVLEDRRYERNGGRTHTPEYGPLRLLGIPIKLSDTPAAWRRSYALWRKMKKC